MPSASFREKPVVSLQTRLISMIFPVVERMRKSESIVSKNSGASTGDNPFNKLGDFMTLFCLKSSGINTVRITAPAL